MSRPADTGLAPLKRLDGEPVFDAPWQASVLAMADALVERGIITPAAWSEALGAALKEAERAGEPDTAATYYRCALAALERVAEAHGGISSAALGERRHAWEAAYRSTPHGKPVRLPEG